MKTASAPLQSLILGGSFVAFECYTITLSGGTVLRYTTADFSITDGTDTWTSSGPIVDDPESRPTAHWKVGLDVDTWTMVVMPRQRDPVTGAAYPDTILGMPWLSAAVSGVLDGATVLVQRAYLAAPPSNPVPAAGVTPTGFLTIFLGIVAEVDIGPTRATVQIRDMRQLLTTMMPRLIYQAPCTHILFDNRCGLSAAAFAVSGTALAGSTNGVIQASVSAPSGSGTFTLGTLRFTSGLNAGVSRTIRSWNGASALSLTIPMPYLVSAGDTFVAYPGCDKQLTTCAAFGNRVNYSGTPFLPVPETTV